MRPRNMFLVLIALAASGCTISDGSQFCGMPPVEQRCASGLCQTKGGTTDCKPIECVDNGKRDGTETDLDCGGGCRPCSDLGDACRFATDCSSGICENGKCAAHCTDGKKSGSETNVDCGGGFCPACAVSSGCLRGGDCTSGLCTNGICQASDCTNGVVDGKETDLDCGGPKCEKCGKERRCSWGLDCASGNCVDFVCK